MSRIYVSSTFSDLQDQREAVYRALRRLGHDVVAMEDYVASDQRPLDRCLDDVASSDVYIGIARSDPNANVRERADFGVIFHL